VFTAKSQGTQGLRKGNVECRMSNFERSALGFVIRSVTFGVRHSILNGIRSKRTHRPKTKSPGNHPGASNQTPHPTHPLSAESPILKPLIKQLQLPYGSQKQNLFHSSGQLVSPTPYEFFQPVFVSKVR
jgi:hypothetical protein